MIKSTRQEKILELVLSQDIEKQDELLAKLKEAGYNVTQATVSRDIKELKLFKEVAPGGGYRYAVRNKKDGENRQDAFNELLLRTALSADYAGNIVAVKCRTGMAQGTCAALDEAGLSAVVATLAGDDTIFVLARTEEQARILSNQLLKLMRGLNNA